MINPTKAIIAALIAHSAISHAQQVIPLEPFNQIVVRNASNVSLKQSNANSIILPNNADSLKVKYHIRNNALIIEGRVQSLSLTAAQAITAIDVEGAGSLTVTDTLQVSDIELSISGTGRLGALLIANNVKTDISGAGNVAISGTANAFSVDISGSGRVNAEYLKVKNATINISGSGRATVDATDNLNVSVSGSGSVYYKTKPATINQALSGVGSVRQLSNQDDSDTTHIQIGNMNIDISGLDTSKFKNIPRKSSGNWAGFDIGFNGYLSNSGNSNPPQGYEFLELIPEKSIAVNFNFYDYDLKIYKHYLIGTTGIGLSYNNYRFRKDFTLTPDSSTIWYTTDTVSYKKNKLTVSYLTVPVLLTLNTHELAKKSFHVTTGVLLGYKVGSHTKQVYDVDSEKKKDKKFDDFNLNPFRTDVTLRLGYGNYVTVFANYALTTLFKSNQGPQLHAWTFGVSLTGW